MCFSLSPVVAPCYITCTIHTLALRSAFCRSLEPPTFFLTMPGIFCNSHHKILASATKSNASRSQSSPVYSTRVGQRTAALETRSDLRYPAQKICFDGSRIKLSASAAHRWALWASGQCRSSLLTALN